MLKSLLSKFRTKTVDKPDAFYCLTPYLNTLDPIKNPRTRIRNDGQKEKEVGKDRKTGRTIWLPLSD